MYDTGGLNTCVLMRTPCYYLRAFHFKTDVYFKNLILSHIFNTNNVPHALIYKKKMPLNASQDNSKNKINTHYPPLKKRRELSPYWCRKRDNAFTTLKKKLGQEKFGMYVNVGAI